MTTEKREKERGEKKGLFLKETVLTGIRGVLDRSEALWQTVLQVNQLHVHDHVA